MRRCPRSVPTGCCRRWQASPFGGAATIASGLAGDREAALSAIDELDTARGRPMVAVGLGVRGAGTVVLVVGRLGSRAAASGRHSRRARTMPRSRPSEPSTRPRPISARSTTPVSAPPSRSPVKRARRGSSLASRRSRRPGERGTGLVPRMARSRTRARGRRIGRRGSHQSRDRRPAVHLDPHRDEPSRPHLHQARALVARSARRLATGRTPDRPPPTSRPIRRCTMAEREVLRLRT